MGDEQAKARAEARARWPGRVTSLAEQDDAGVVRGGTPAERIAMVWRVTRDAWAASGRPWPSYSRATMPGRIIRAPDG